MKNTHLLLLLLCLTLSACINRSEEVVLNTDGSGTLRVQSDIPSAMVESLGKFFSFMFEDMAGSNLDIMNALLAEEGMDSMESVEEMQNLHGFTQESLEAVCATTGSELVDFTAEVVDDVDSSSFEVHFPSVAALDEIMASMTTETAGIELVRRGDEYEFRCTKADQQSNDAIGEGELSPELQARVDSLAANFEDDPRVMGLMMEMMGSMMSAGATADGFRVLHQVTVPGDVQDHNAHMVDQRTVTWSYDMENLMSGGLDDMMGATTDSTGSQLSETNRWVVFSAKGLELPEVGVDGR